MISSRQRIRAWLLEPFTLFVLLGLSLFAMDRLLNGAPLPAGAEVRQIVISASQQAVLREAFRTERGRLPDAAEIQAQIDHWVEEEVLYREALALGLDRKDVIVHRQLTQKMRFLLDDAVPLPPASDAELQVWLDQHMQQYGRPATLSFEQVFLSRGEHGDAMRAQAAHIAAQLEQAPESFASLGDPFPSGRQVTAANAVQLRHEFGADFTAAIQGLPAGSWSAPIASSFGLHFVRVTARSDFHPATLEQVRERVRIDYQIAQHEQLGRTAVERLKQKYHVEIEGGA